MFRDMVESVMLLNDEDWRDREKDEDTLKETTLIAWGVSGVSPSPFWVLWVSVCGGDGVSRDGTMCSAPSSCWTCSSITDDMPLFKTSYSAWTRNAHYSPLSSDWSWESRDAYQPIVCISVVVYQSMENLAFVLAFQSMWFECTLNHLHEETIEEPALNMCSSNISLTLILDLFVYFTL